MRKFEILFPALAIVFTVFVVAAGALYYNYSMTVMRFPYVVGGLLVLLAGWRLIGAVRGESLPGEPEVPKEIAAGSTGQFLRTGLWMLGILLAVQVCGYLAGIPLYLLAYFKAHGENWRTSILLSISALIVTYFVFIVFLKVRLPIMPIGFG